MWTRRSGFAATNRFPGRRRKKLPAPIREYLAALDATVGSEEKGDGDGGSGSGGERHKVPEGDFFQYALNTINILKESGREMGDYLEFGVSRRTSYACIYHALRQTGVNDAWRQRINPQRDHALFEKKACHHTR
jgi:hypothetical protein